VIAGDLIGVLMSLFAGVFFRERSVDACTQFDSEELIGILNRSQNKKINTLHKGGFWFCSVGHGVETVDDHNGKDLAILAGNPFFQEITDAESLDRKTQARALHKVMATRDYKMLESGRGEFCAVYYDEKSHALSLISDKLTIRPLYYYVTAKFVAFSSALWVLEQFPLVPKVMDFRGVTETLYLGFPLGERTVYSGIRLLKASEVLEIRQERIDSSLYWRWDRLGLADEPEDLVLTKVYENFLAAVRLRAGSLESAIAFLSGGLDSRCVVASLRQQKLQVRTLNFSRKNSLDQLYGRRFSEAVKTSHEEYFWETDPQWSLMMAQALNATGVKSEEDAARGPRVWSGDGGSVGVGHVYLDEIIVALMREGKVAAAVQRYLQQRGAVPPRKMFSSKIQSKIHNLLEIGILEELEKINSPDPGRGFHLFLMLNDQRRHLAKHFEDIDIHNLEFVLPFFDFEFLSSIIASPIDMFLRHKFYNKWLNLYQKEVTSVPWQDYPGHEPCPVRAEKSDSSGYQWGEAFQKDFGRKKRGDIKLLNVLKMFKNKQLGQILDQKNVALASLATKLGVKDFGYIYTGACSYNLYLEKCLGKIEL
jgi:asparagine synthase (glutamine-hydrolysing)